MFLMRRCASNTLLLSDAMAFTKTSREDKDMKHRTLIAAMVVLVFAVVVQGDVEQKADTPANYNNTDEFTAQEIITKVESTYATCNSYMDTGLVRTVHKKKEERDLVIEKTFSTAFVRPDRYRFEFNSAPPDSKGVKHERYIIWANGDDVRTWWHVRPEVEKERDLGGAIAGATGVSSGSAHDVPTLLMHDVVGGNKITAQTGLERLEDAEENGVPCYRVAGIRKTAFPHPITLWVSKETFLIHRIDSTIDKPKTDESEAYQLETTKTYNPKINVEIKPSRLAFDAPVFD